MSGTDVVLIALTIVALAAVAVLAVTVMQLRSLIGGLRDELNEFTARAHPAAHDLVEAANHAAAQVDRLEHLISVASSVTDTMDTATAATVRVLSSPVIKTAAMARGTRKAARRLKSAEGD